MAPSRRKRLPIVVQLLLLISWSLSATVLAEPAWQYDAVGPVTGNAVDAESGEQVWHANTGTTHTRPAVNEGIAVVGSWDNHLYGLKLEDGSVGWKVRSRLLEGEIVGWLGWEGFNLDPVIHDGVVYLGNRGTHLYAIDAATGVEKWSGKHPTSWIGSPAVVSGGVIYFGLSDGFALVGLDARNGNQTLLFRNRFYNFARPQANENHVFLASLSGELFAIATGKGRKLFATGASKANLPQLQSAGGGLEYLYSKEGYTHENATRDVQRMLSELDSLTLAGDTLYAGSAAGSRTPFRNRGREINACKAGINSHKIEAYSFRPAEGLALRRRGNHRS
jgi:outer membrane protein assembly factor BamB